MDSGYPTKSNCPELISFPKIQKKADIKVINRSQMWF